MNLLIFGASESVAIRPLGYSSVLLLVVAVVLGCAVLDATQRFQPLVIALAYNLAALSIVFLLARYIDYVRRALRYRFDQDLKKGAYANSKVGEIGARLSETQQGLVRLTDDISNAINSVGELQQSTADLIRRAEDAENLARVTAPQTEALMRAADLRDRRSRKRDAIFCARCRCDGAFRAISNTSVAHESCRVSVRNRPSG